MRLGNLRLGLAFAAGLGIATACGPSVERAADAGENGGGDGGGTGDDAGPRPDAGPPAVEAVVYAHSSDELYRVNPDTLQVTLVGPFQWPSGTSGEQMTDIAVDKDGKITGISFGAVYSVDPNTAACTFLSYLDRGGLNGLSWVPVGVIDGTEEVLVGAGLDGEFLRIDPLTGAQTSIGTYGGGLVSSGDIVSVEGFGTVATVKMFSSDNNDYLARVDPATGQVTQLIGQTGVNDIWGLGFWKGKVYGFAATNQFVLIDVTTGTASVVEVGPVNWWGAGVTTRAPIIP